MAIHVQAAQPRDPISRILGIRNNYSETLTKLHCLSFEQTLQTFIELSLLSRFRMCPAST